VGKGDGRDPGEARSELRSEVQPGQLSEFLRQLAHVSEGGLGGSWDLGLRPGEVIGRFELVREIGRGGFGVVWEARDRTLGRLVAFKAVRAGRQARLSEERLLAEAEAVARLSHPNIVALHDVGHSKHGPYLVLELLRGETLEARLGTGDMPVREALRVAAEIARGLAHAHALGVVHRDLKPGNVFLCQDGQVKLLDFGLSHALGRRRQDGGTPAFMAPEQQQGAPEDERTDVFALGVILFRMLSGRMPFPPEDGGKELLSARPAPGLEVPEAPGLAELVARMLEKQPTRRPRDGAEVSAALWQLASGPEVTPASAGPVRVRRRPRWRLPAIIATGLLAGAGGVCWARRPAPPPPLDASGRVVVAVADVENRTGEAPLDALTGLLVTSLEQSRRLLVLTRSRMLDLARQEGRDGVERVDEVLGRDLGRKAGARVLLVPVVHRLGGTYALELRAVDPVKDQHLFAAREQSPDQAGLLGAIDRLSDRTRRELQESPQEVAAGRIQVGDAITRSLEAYQHYLRGRELRLQRCDLPGDEREQRQALQHDPAFAMAHWELSTALGYMRGHDRTEEGDPIPDPERLADRMPEKERLMLQLSPYVSVGAKDIRANRAEALRIAAELLARFPEDKFAVYLVGVAYHTLGEWDEAVAHYRRSLALDPGQCYVVTLLVNALLGADRSAEAVEVARRGLAATPGPWTESILSYALARRQTLAEAARHARAALAADDGNSLMVSASASCPLLAAGHPEEVEAVARRHRERGTGSPDGVAFLEAPALGLQGRIGDLRRRLAGIPVSSSFEPPPVFLAAGSARREARETLAGLRRTPASRTTIWFLAFFGEIEGATEQASRLAPDPLQERFIAAARLLRDRPAEAVEPLRALRGLWLAEALLPEALLAAGKPAEALAALDALGPMAVCSGYTQAQATLLRAEALERLGRRSEALAEVEALLALWKRADPDLPLLAVARRWRARLAGAGPGPPAR